MNQAEMHAAATSPPEPAFEGWCICDQLGHKRIAGKASEVVIAGAPMLRIDVPADPAHPSSDCLNCRGLGRSEGIPCGMDCCGPRYVTQFIGGQSIYALTPCSEAAARVAAKGNQPQPVHSWDFPKQLTSAEASVQRDLDDDEELYGDEDDHSDDLP